MTTPSLDKTPSWFRNLILNGLVTLIGVLGLEYAKANWIDKKEAQPSRPSYVVTLTPDAMERFLTAFETFAQSQQEMAQNIRTIKESALAQKLMLQRHMDDVALNGRALR